MPERVEVYFDGTCVFCRRQMERLLRRDVQGRLSAIDAASPGFRTPGPTLAAFRAELHVRTPDGRWARGLEAVETLWRTLPPTVGSRLGLAMLQVLGMRALGRVGYRFIARHRYRLGGKCDSGTCGIG